MDAGRFDQRVTFKRYSEIADGSGNETGPYVPISGLVSIPAAFRPEFGREALEAGRLESTMRGTLTIRRFALSATITPADQAVFVNAPYAGVACQIRSIVPTPDRAFLEIVIESGVAQ